MFVIKLLTGRLTREEAIAERKREREHQLLVLEGMFAKLIELVNVQNAPIIALAAAQAAQSESFGTWVQSFTAHALEPPTPSSIPREDEWYTAAGQPSKLPPEFALAHQLMRDELPAAEDYDREGRF
jgi:hypothetical protein